MVRRAAKAKSNTVRIDLSDVETLARFKEDGDFPLRVVEVTQEKGDRYPYLSWVLESTDPDTEGARVYNNTSMAPQSLWNVRAMLEAIGEEIPDEEFDLDLESLADKELMGSIEMEVYEGKKRPRLVDFWELEEKPKGKAGKKSTKVKDDEEDDEKPARRGKTSKRKAPADVTEDDIGDMSQDELQDLIDTHGLEVDLDDFKTLRKMQAAVIDAAQEAEILADTEEPEPAPRRRGAAKTEDDEEEEKPTRRSRRAAKPEPEEDEEDERPTRRARRARR